MESHEGTHNPAGKHQHHPKSTSELMSSAKLVADAAKSTFNKNPNHQVDKGRVAGAAADLLEAASHYGKLEENKTYGKYVEKAENYLHQYHSSQSTTTAASTGHSEGGHTKHSETHSGGADGEKSGYGDYMKMAQGFLKSHGNDKTESDSSGGDGEKSGYGDYFKMAQGFLKK